MSHWLLSLKAFEICNCRVLVIKIHTFELSFRAFFKLADSDLSMSCTSCNSFHEISPPGTSSFSWKPLNEKGGEINLFYLASYSLHSWSNAQHQRRDKLAPDYSWRTNSLHHHLHQSAALCRNIAWIIINLSQTTPRTCRTDNYLKTLFVHFLRMV